MLLVVSIRNVFVFLLAWEMMSLISYLLILFEHDNEKSIRASTIYIVMTHIGTAFLIAAFILLYQHAGSFDLLVMKDSVSTLPLATKNLLFIFFLIGFGTKAGIVPLHIWLPFAHPQAPSHISALMSGVMIKTAIYGLLRFVLFLLGASSLWWGVLVLALAVMSSLVGVIYALIEQDLKTLLAYSSVENVGIILIGIGASMIFLRLGFTGLALLALSAGLYHLVNHAAFKGLLFLGAGSVYKATGTRDLEKMGGLIHRMPWTAGMFLIGAMAISALPPLNGFVSEWLTLISLFIGALVVSGKIKLIFLLSAAGLALTGGLAAATFVKAFGLVFLGRPRSRKAEEAQEVPLSMNLSAGYLALLCVVLGLGAGWVLQAIFKVAGIVIGIKPAHFSYTLQSFIGIPQIGNGVFLSTPLIAGLLALSAAVTCLILYLVLGKGRVRVGKTWDCGYYQLTPRNEYTATAFSKPFRLAFSFFLQPYRKSQKIRTSTYHVKSQTYETGTQKIMLEYLYAPILKWTFSASRFAKKAQPGSIHLYLGYIFAVTIILVAYVAGR